MIKKNTWIFSSWDLHRFIVIYKTEFLSDALFPLLFAGRGVKILSIAYHFFLGLF